MFKAVWFVRFAQGMAQQDGRRYWAEYDGPMGASASIERYVQNHVIGPIPSATGAGAEPFFDGYSLGSWRDRAAFDETMASPGWQPRVEAGPNVFAMTRLEGMSAELREFTVIEGPSSPFKVVWIADFKEGLDPAEAHGYWENVHGSICKEMEITSSGRSRRPALLALTGFRSCGSRTRPSSGGRWRATLGQRPWWTAPTCSTCQCYAAPCSRSASSKKRWSLRCADPERSAR
jgi:hypothetical protein